MRVICFIIHGIGTQDQNFSQPLSKGVHAKLLNMKGGGSSKKVDTRNIDYQPQNHNRDGRLIIHRAR